MRDCVHCKGQLEHSSAPFSVDRNGYHVSWDALPAWVCTQCGEPAFETAVVEAIQRTLQDLDRTTSDLTATAG
jgi:YgiT-type zinc finger domain-containing protein